jgi:hypothetical protein
MKKYLLVFMLMFSLSGYGQITSLQAGSINIIYKNPTKPSGWGAFFDTMDWDIHHAVIFYLILGSEVYDNRFSAFYSLSTDHEQARQVSTVNDIIPNALITKEVLDAVVIGLGLRHGEAEVSDKIKELLNDVPIQRER